MTGLILRILNLCYASPLSKSPAVSSLRCFNKLHMQDASKLSVQLRILRNFFRKHIDSLVIHKSRRWTAFAAVLGLFLFRMVYHQGYFAVCYILGFYILQNVILFLTPSSLPSIQDEEENEEHVYDIPDTQLEKSEDSSKPIIRKLGEFNLWKKLMLGALVSLFTTFFEVLDFPVFWPILMFYFVFVALSIGIKQRRHMKKYGYSLSDFFKKGDKTLNPN